MPLRFGRWLVVIALALGVPLQGFAAVTAGLCMALEHHDARHVAAHDPGHAHCAPCVACCVAAAISSFTPVVLA